MALNGFGLVVLAYSVYALRFWRSRPPGRTRDAAWWTLAVALGATIAWGIAGVVDVVSSKLLSWHLSLLFDHVRYAAWIGFVWLILGGRLEGGAETRPRRRWIVGVAALLAVAIVANIAFASSWVGIATALRGLAFVQLAWAVTGLVFVEQLFRNANESSKWAIKPLCLSLGCLFVYDLYLYAQAAMFGFDADVLAARALVHAGAVPLLWIASRRNTPSLEGLRVSKDVAFYSASLLLAGAYMLIVAAAGYYVRYFGGTWGGALQVALVAVATLLLATVVLSRTQRARVRVFLGKHFYRYHYDYRVEWLRFTAMLSAPADPQEFGLQIVRGLADLVESPGGSLWLRASNGSAFVQTQAWNMPRVDASEPAASAFCTRMTEHEWIVDFSAAAPLEAPASDLAARPDWLSAAGATWLAIPLMVGGEMRGFVLLVAPRTPIALNWEVRDLLKTAARQAAGFLALMQATEALVETRKFDAFNRMSAFVVHDLKNIVTQLSLMLRNAERHRDNPEFQQDMLMTVNNSLEKMKQLMLQLREGERPEGLVAGVELAPLLQRLQQAAARRGRELTVEVRERLTTRGHEQRLERVIGHVVQNALDATPVGGKVWARLERAGGRAVVVVGDSGAGMSQEFIRTRLFRPFSSTKAHGMGIGLFESLQYLKDLGGGVEVVSDEGQGTVVTMTMPLFGDTGEADPTADGRRTGAAFSQ